MDKVSCNWVDVHPASKMQRVWGLFLFVWTINQLYGFAILSHNRNKFFLCFWCGFWPGWGMSWGIVAVCFFFLCRYIFPYRACIRRMWRSSVFLKIQWEILVQQDPCECIETGFLIVFVIPSCRLWLPLLADSYRIPIHLSHRRKECMGSQDGFKEPENYDV